MDEANDYFKTHPQRKDPPVSPNHDAVQPAYVENPSLKPKAMILNHPKQHSKNLMINPVSNKMKIFL